ncbi:hypothetical protein ACFC1R_35520 [Kitasatospora sp. NPDC056138]|uniref:hypothetical protein n=1 Tax=Kitasatospora sp. NPDC056138 TaxID=3345724 RepID=UPI0035DC9795
MTSIERKRGLSAAVPDRRFAAVEHTPVAAAEDAERPPFGTRTPPFPIAAGSELGRIGTARPTMGWGGTMPRQYVEQRADAVVHRRLDELLRDGRRRRGLRPAPPEPPGGIACGVTVDNAVVPTTRDDEQEVGS